MLSFGVIIILTFLFTLFSINLTLENSKAMNQLFSKLNATGSISIKLTDVHQNLANLINYKNPDIVSLFEESLKELIRYVKEVDPMMYENANLANDMNLYYKFLDIQNLIYTYRERSMVLSAMTKYEKSRIVLYDNLYDLKYLKSSIHEALTELLFKQTVVINAQYEKFSGRMRRQVLFSVLLSLGVSIVFIFFSFWISRSISTPIELLAERAARASSGDFEDRGQAIRADAEIQVLVDSFNHMIAQIRNLIRGMEEKSSLERKLKEEEIKLLKIENSLRESEMQTLQSQINPHFLFNTINTISALASIEEAAMTGKLLQDMSNILRFSLKKAKEKASIREEIEIIKNYLNIQRTRFGDRITTVIETDEEALDEKIPPMTLQPLVENAMIHGLEPKEGIGTLTIRVARESAHVKIEITDDGVGMEEEEFMKIQRLCIEPELNNWNKLGIVNVIRRLKLTYGENVLIIESRLKKGTTVSIAIPTGRNA
jgi:two-component system sensor histidine kinase YesM